MKLPNGHRAIVDLVKLRDYCLSPQHPTGRHKARVFRAALGFDQSRYRWPKSYVIDFTLTATPAAATVRSCWIIRTGEDVPRLTSCFVLPKGQATT